MYIIEDYKEITNNFCGGKNPSNDVLIEWKMWALNIHHSNSDFFKMDLVIDSNCNVNQTITASLLFFKSNGNQFLGNLSDLNSVLFDSTPDVIFKNKKVDLNHVDISLIPESDDLYVMLYKKHYISQNLYHLYMIKKIYTNI